MKKLIILILILISLSINTATPQAQTEETTDIQAFWELWFNQKMDEHHVPGAVFVLVKDGEVLLSKGYGFANVEQQIPINPDETLFHLGSISKIMTAMAIMKLVEQNKLDLHTDVTQYLTTVQIDKTYSEPITLFNLLTHTAGFEQHGLSTATRGLNDYTSLSGYFQNRPPHRLMPPNEVIIYSSVGVSLAGQVIEDTTNIPFATFVHQSVFEPMEMSHSMFLAPPNYPSHNTLAVGYRYQNASYIPYTDFYYSLIPPGGNYLSTGNDMGNFIITQLTQGRLGEVQLYQPETIEAMQTQQVTHHPTMRGRSIGFSEWFENEQQAVYHDGGAPGFLSRLYLLPKHNLGFFISHNNGNAYPFNHELTSTFMDFYFSEIKTQNQTPQSNKEFNTNLSAMVGYYSNYDLSPYWFGKINSLFNQFPVSIGQRQALNLGSSPYIQVEPNLFQSEDGSRYVSFRFEGEQVTHLLRDTTAYRKTSQFESQPVQLTFLAILLLSFLTAIIVPFFTSFNKKRSSYFRWLATLISLVNIAFIVLLAINLMSIMENDIWALTYGLTPTLEMIFLMPMLSFLLSIILFIITILSWKEKYWSLFGRLHYTWVLIASLGYIYFLNYWHLLLWPF